MRKLIAAVAIVLMTLTAGAFAPPARASADVSFDFFYSNLQPYGSWQISGSYGRVWQPRDYAPDWNPYYDGHWAYADVGWVWVSDYPWGSIPYHYGTWTMDPEMGWVWVPGYTWAPAWVTFRTGPDYIGWAPVAPGFSIGVSVGAPPPASFVFVASRDFAAPRIRTCAVPEARVATVIRQTTVVRNVTIENHVVVNRGPDVREVERASGRQFRPVPVEQVSRVAPFSGVQRAQLAVPAERGTRGIKAAEPVSPSRALPSASERAALSVPDREPRHANRETPRPNGVDAERPHGPGNQPGPALEPQRPHAAPPARPPAPEPRVHETPAPAKPHGPSAQPQKQQQPQKPQDSKKKEKKPSGHGSGNGNGNGNGKDSGSTSPTEGGKQ